MIWPRRLARVILPSHGKHRGQPSRRGIDPPWWWKPWLSRRVEKQEELPVDEQWIRDLLPPTPQPRESAEAAPWAPRITRWIRLTSPLPDDTILLSPIPAATVLEFMGRGFLWDPSR